MRLSKRLIAAMTALVLCPLSAEYALAEEKTNSKRSDTATNTNLLKVNPSGGLRFDSQGAGTPNSLSGYFFLPFTQDQKGSLFFVEGFGSWNYGSELGDNNFGGSSRLGYRWMDKPKTWLFGLNGGVDTTPYNNSYYWQAGLGAEALSKNFEARINGYIPFGDTNEFVSSGINSAYLASNRLYLNAYEKWTTSFGGAEIELGVPLARWKSGSLWAYSGYYYLNSAVAEGPTSSGYKARAEIRLGTNLALGTTFTYDNIFSSRALGYISYGSRPVGFSAKDAVDAAEAQFFANRGLPVNRQRDVRIGQVTINKPNVVARSASSGSQLTVRCVGISDNGSSCSYSDLTGAVNAGSSDVILLANGTTSDLGSAQLNLPAGVTLASTSTASLNTQYGVANLSSYFRSGSSGQAPAVINGILGIGSGTTISGLAFTDATITNYSTSNVLISGNTFTRSYSSDPTGISGSARPAIDFDGVSNVTIAGNSFTDPAVKSYIAPNPVTSVPTTYLSGRAISLVSSTGISVANNTVSGALGEGIGLDNATGTVSITGNTISGMKAGPDTNLEAGIFIRNDSGTSNITISNNSISTNTAFRIDSAGNTTSSLNSTDGIEVNLCRGSSFASADRFTDGLFGDCLASTTSIATISNNTVSNLNGGADGLDINIGQNANLTLLASGNNVTNVGDEGLTFDIRDNANTTTTIANNILQSNNAKGGSTDGIALTIGSDASTVASGRGSFSISGNTIGVIGSASTPDSAEGIKIDILGRTGTSTGFNYDFVIANNTINVPTGDVIEISTQTSSAYGSSSILAATISNNLLTKQFTGGNEGFKFTTASGFAGTSTLDIQNNIINILGSATAYAFQIVQSGSGTTNVNLLGNSAPLNGGGTSTIRLEPTLGTLNNVNNASTSTNNNGMTYPNPAGTVNSINQLP